MRRGVSEGTITVDARETPHPKANRDPDDDDFYVYGQATCRRCGARIKEIPLSGRRMFACPTCQPKRRSYRSGPSLRARLSPIR
jgi:formamidopyrimidine-DNA glycosylase